MTMTIVIGSLKPFIISAPNGNMKQTAIDSKVAKVTEAKDVKAIKLTILEFYELWQNNLLPIGNKDFANKFERKYLTGLLARELSHIARYNQF